jgi:hypothetical protein
MARIYSITIARQRGPRTSEIAGETTTTRRELGWTAWWLNRCLLKWFLTTFTKRPWPTIVFRPSAAERLLLAFLTNEEAKTLWNYLPICLWLGRNRLIGVAAARRGWIAKHNNDEPAALASWQMDLLGTYPHLTADLDMFVAAAGDDATETVRTYALAIMAAAEF